LDKVLALSEFDLVSFAHSMAADTREAIKLFAANQSTLAQNVSQIALFFPEFDEFVSIDSDMLMSCLSHI
jgi:hypothetical protein